MSPTAYCIVFIFNGVLTPPLYRLISHKFLFLFELYDTHSIVVQVSFVQLENSAHTYVIVLFKYTRCSEMIWQNKTTDLWNSYFFIFHENDSKSWWFSFVKWLLYTLYVKNKTWYYKFQVHNACSYRKQTKHFCHTWITVESMWNKCFINKR